MDILCELIHHGWVIRAVNSKTYTLVPGETMRPNAHLLVWTMAKEGR